MLPRDTVLGQLEIVEVYETHDVPRLFLAINNTGQQFIALWVDYDDDTETWLYLQVSTARLRMIRHAEHDLRSAFRDSETGYVWTATVTLEAGTWKVEWVDAGAIDDAYLPDVGQTIKLPERAPAEIRSSSLADLAIGSRRDALAVALYYANRFRYEAPVRELGKFMEAFQDQLDVLGQSRRGKFGPGGSVGDDIKQQTQVVFDSTFPSSFGMRLVASLPADLTGESLAALAIQDLMLIISLTDAQLPLFLKSANNRIAVKYRKLLASLLDNQAGLRIAWQRAGTRELIHAALSYERVGQAYNIVSAVEDEESEIIKVRGILNGVNLRTKTYELSTPDNKKRYTGKILASALGQASIATMSLLYDAVIQMTLEVETATGAEKAHYFLVDLKKVD